MGEIAGQRGMSLREARSEFLTLRHRAPSGRQPRANAAELRDLGVIPADPATRHALRVMAERGPVLPPVRLVQRWIPVPGDGETTIARIGASDLSNRIEVHRRDGSTVAYRVPRDRIQAFESTVRHQPPDQFLALDLERAGERVPRVEATAFAVRCDECGQFIGDSWHDCPGRSPVALVAQQEYVDGESRLSAPPAASVAELIDTNHGRPVRAPIRYITTEADVEGTVLLRPGLSAVRGRDRTSRQLVDLDDAAPDELTCRSCHSTGCRHIAQTREAIRSHLQAAGGLPQEEVSAALHGLGVVLDDVANPVRRRRRSWPPRCRSCPTRKLSEPPSASLEPPRTARRCSRRCRSSKPMVRCKAMPATPVSAWRSSSMPVVIELVTPIMSDTEESWRQLDLACDSIRRHGGTTDLAGSHTNISSGSYTPEMAWRLVNLIRAHEDDIYRMGRTRRSARYESYNSPFPDPGPQWQSRHDAHQSQSDRQRMINFTAAFESSSARIEFRFPDAFT